MPRASVLLPVYNGAPYLRESIDSILSQSFTDFELLVLNDGSSDSSAEIVREYSDRRIRYFEHQNVGLPATLNKGLALAEGEVIFRQDQDDVSLPKRIATQMDFLDRNPGVVLVGTWAVIIDERGRPVGRMHCHPRGTTALRVESLVDSPFVHSSVAMRRDVVLALGGYATDKMRQPPEDYELWSRLLRTCQAANIAQPLVLYREVSNSMSRTMKPDFFKRVVRISAENLSFWAGRGEPDSTSEFTARLIHAPNEPHDHSIELMAVKALFDAACEGIVCKSGSFDQEARRSRERLLFALTRAWSVGLRRSGVGRLLARAMWKTVRLFRRVDV